MASCKPCDIPEQELIIKVANKIAGAMDRDHPFTMTFKQVQKLFDSQTACAYSGNMFSTIGDITFERINPNLGYVPGNVVLVKKNLNQLKGDTIDRFIHMSSLPKDALADIFSRLARSLKKEFEEEQEKKLLQNSKLEERIQAEIAASKAVNGAVEEPKPEVPVTAGARLLMATFKAAKENKEKKNNETVPIK